MSRKVLIIGAGISGLSTAEALHRRGASAGTPIEVEVLEASSVAGGKIRSSVDDGFVVETGPHGFLDKEPKMFELIDRLGLNDELIPADTSSARRFIVRAQKMRELPSSPPSFLFSDILPLSGKLRLLFEPFARSRPDAEESVWEFASRRIGRQAADVLVDAMVTGIYGGDPKELSLRAAFPRMFELESDYGSLVRAQIAVARTRRKQLTAGAHQPKQSAAGAPAGTLHSFKRGLGTLTTALAERATVRTDHPLQALRPRRGGGYEAVTPHGTHEADAIVLTTPCATTASLIQAWDGAPPAVEALHSITYAAVHVVVHAFEASAVSGGRLDGFGFLIPGGEQRDILGSIWASSVFPDHAPDGTVMFRTMLGGWRRPDLATASDEVLAQKAREELVAFSGLDPKAQPVLERVIRWEDAIPQYTKGHLDRVAAVEAFEGRQPGLFVSGNGLRGVALLNCVAEADKVAERLLNDLSA